MLDKMRTQCIIDKNMLVKLKCIFENIDNYPFVDYKYDDQIIRENDEVH